MSRKVLMVYGLLIMFAATTTMAFAEEVYVTGKGSKYHKISCRLIRNKDAAKALDKDEAIASGHEPCKVCFKENLLTDDEADQGKGTQMDKKSKGK